jgi:hypothetical protein
MRDPAHSSDPVPSPFSAFALMVLKGLLIGLYTFPGDIDKKEDEGYT